jgi:hypothetical protein
MWGGGIVARMRLWWCRGGAFDNARRGSGLGPKFRNRAIMARFRAGSGPQVDTRAHWGPLCGNLRGGELGVSCYGGRWCCSPWDLNPFLYLPLPLLPTHFPPSLLLHSS